MFMTPFCDFFVGEDHKLFDKHVCIISNTRIYRCWSSCARLFSKRKNSFCGFKKDFSLLLATMCKYFIERKGIKNGLMKSGILFFSLSSRINTLFVLHNLVIYSPMVTEDSTFGHFCLSYLSRRSDLDDDGKCQFWCARMETTEVI